MIKGNHLNNSLEVISMEEYLKKRRMIRENEAKEKNANDIAEKSTLMLAELYV